MHNKNRNYPPVFIFLIVSSLLAFCMISATSCESDEGLLEPKPYQVLDSILSIKDISVEDVRNSMIDLLREALDTMRG